MRTDFNHEIDNDPEPEHAGAIMVTATIFGDDDNFNPPFTTTSLPIRDFFDDECQSIQELKYFLLEAEIDDDVIADAMMNLVVYVDGVTCSTSSSEYSPGCALEVQLDLFPDYLDDDDTQSQIEEALQVSFDETSNNTRFRPASKLVVKSLTRKVYNKKIKKEKRNKKEIYKKISLEECTICLQEFSNGGTVVTLPCGHDFDDECIAKWFETSHVCPLCRFELPCEDQSTNCSIGCEFSTRLYI